MKTNAKITISRNINNTNQIIISVTDNNFKKDIDIIIAPEQLALALTGLGYQDCNIEKREESTIIKSERKRRGKL